MAAAELNKLLETVLAAAKKAEGGDAAEQGRALDGLRALRKQPVNTKLLSETQAGRRVKSLSKHPNKQLAAAAAEVVAAWKEVVRKEVDGGAASGGAAASLATSAVGSSKGGAALPRAASQSTVGQAEEQGSQPASQPAAAGGGGSSGAPPAAAAGAPLDLSGLARTGDSIRDKCRQNLAQAFHQAVLEGVAGDPLVCGVAVENEIYNQNGGVSQAYKAKFRQLHFNLKDAANPDLRRKVLSGEIAPDVLHNLPPEELASDAKREENARIREKKLFDAAPSSAKQATTDQFQCGKCKQRKCTYYQMQTRSADEPMTTFVSCMNCNNRWKFC
ncbi:transcription elongation factor A 2-like [Chlorella sorokiniana]|uniref:Transcription elongation factor n=1 Tax=Chlorella sorokiniana TaxID=3076 RepID=A0A2P6TNC7_CHLSO|nr:transcription elongation factor A 2-like [Chlorella sorokiniana]|eukprot:PRW50840.1 transcription elongation factor A 2-like [Chlorella sorokiniana]